MTIVHHYLWLYSMKFIYRLFTVFILGHLLFGCATISDPCTVWIDVRSDEEYQEQHIEGAINIEYTEILEGVAALDKDTEILLYCGSGRRAGIALEALEAEGFTNLTNMGGISEILGEGAN